MASKYNLSEQILQTIVQTDTQDVRISEDGFFERLATGDEHSYARRAARLIAFIAAFITVAVFVIYAAVYFFQVVLFSTNTMSVNRHGAFTISTSANREYAMFMFNSASAWQPSGIQVYSGDKLYISASGGYHTKISKLIDTAKDNKWADKKEEYWLLHDSSKLDSLKKDTICRYVFMSRKAEQIIELDTFHRKIDNPRGLAKNQNPWFGDALLQVIPEYRMRDTACSDVSQIYAIPRPMDMRKRAITIDKSGILAFCINDDIPYNNVGQMLVVMEIYHRISCSQFIGNFFTLSPLDVPFYLYDEIKHRGDQWYWGVYAVLVFFGLSLLELVLYCLIIFSIPFLFLKETWQQFCDFWKSAFKRKKCLN